MIKNKIIRGIISFLIMSGVFGFFYFDIKYPKLGFIVIMVCILSAIFIGGWTVINSVLNDIFNEDE